jgi:predicted enzyme related to lactoylglutathione lyase
MVKFDHMTLFVADPTRSADFYTRSFGFEIEMQPEGGAMIAIRDDADFTIFLVRDAERARGCGAVVLTLQVDAVEAKHAELVAAGVAFVNAPQKLFWGYGAELFDPDGYLLNLWDERTMREKGG